MNVSRFAAATAPQFRPHGPDERGRTAKAIPPSPPSLRRGPTREKIPLHRNAYRSRALERVSKTTIAAGSLLGCLLFLSLTQRVDGREESQIEKSFDQWRPGFVARWSGDPACAQREGLSEYMRWVHRFYFDRDGWYSRSTTILSRIDASHRMTVSSSLEALGLRLAPEWAKPNDCRKVRTWGRPPSLLSVGTQLEAAMAADSGNGAAILMAIESLQKSLDAAGVDK